MRSQSLPCRNSHHERGKHQRKSTGIGERLLSKVLVKICGITNLKDLNVAIGAGADIVGFVTDVPTSPRNLSREKAKALIEATQETVKTAVVTTYQGYQKLKRIHQELDPGIIQIHGLTGSYEDLRKELPDMFLIDAIQANSPCVIDIAVNAKNTFDAVLLDTSVPGKYGGTGIIHDWTVSRRVRDAIYPKPLVLAGGLRPENVKQAICTVKPKVADVSSGVESRPGVKDPDKIFRFIKNVKEVEL